MATIRLTNWPEVTAEQFPSVSDSEYAVHKPCWLCCRRVFVVVVKFRLKPDSESLMEPSLGAQRGWDSRGSRSGLSLALGVTYICGGSIGGRLSTDLLHAQARSSQAGLVNTTF
jgi:hypothetical protein